MLRVCFRAKGVIKHILTGFKHCLTLTQPNPELPTPEPGPAASALGSGATPQPPSGRSAPPPTHDAKLVPGSPNLAGACTARCRGGVGCLGRSLSQSQLQPLLNAEKNPKTAFQPKSRSPKAVAFRPKILLGGYSEITASQGPARPWRCCRGQGILSRGSAGGRCRFMWALRPLILSNTLRGGGKELVTAPPRSPRGRGAPTHLSHSLQGKLGRSEAWGGSPGPPASGGVFLQLLCFGSSRCLFLGLPAGCGREGVN